MLTLSDPGVNGPPTAHPLARGSIARLRRAIVNTGETWRRFDPFIFDLLPCRERVDHGPAFKSFQRACGDSGAASLAAQVIQRLIDAIDGNDLHAVDALLGLVGGGNDGAMKTQLRRFAQPFLAALDRPDFARQTDLAKN
jgi:hypothetical protein